MQTLVCVIFGIKVGGYHAKHKIHILIIGDMDDFVSAVRFILLVFGSVFAVAVIEMTVGSDEYFESFCDMAIPPFADEGGRHGQVFALLRRDTGI